MGEKIEVLWYPPLLACIRQGGRQLRCLHLKIYWVGIVVPDCKQTLPLCPNPCTLVPRFHAERNFWWTWVGLVSYGASLSRCCWSFGGTGCWCSFVTWSFCVPRFLAWVVRTDDWLCLESPGCVGPSCGPFPFTQIRTTFNPLHCRNRSNHCL